MRSSVRPIRGRLPLLVVLATLLVVSLATVVQAHADPTEVMPQSAPSASGGVAEPTGGDTTVSGTPGAAEPTGDGAQHVEPGTPVKDPRPVAIDHINVAGDGITATIYYWGGTDTCYALASVDVKTGAKGVPTITVYQGTLASLPADQPCIEIAVLYATTVTLEQPLFIDWAQAGPGA
jgi:hypothetical protein